MVSRFSFALVALIAAVAAGCLGGTSARSPHLPPKARRGTLSGLVVMAGGIQRVADNGGIADLRPVRAAPILISGRTSAGAGLRRSTTTDGLGRFQLSLPAGRYDVAAPILPSARAEPHKRVVMRTGHAARIRIAISVQ